MVLETELGSVALSFTVTPGRLSAVFFPAAAVTLPVTDAEEAFAAGPAFCAKPEIAPRSMPRVNAPPRACQGPTHPLREYFKRLLLERSGALRPSRAGRIVTAERTQELQRYSLAAKKSNLPPQFVPCDRGDQVEMEDSEMRVGKT